jgi:YegS/Rv2252/BmrU family lipid kinase
MKNITNQRILLIINPLAGGTEKNTELQIIKNYVENKNYNFVFYQGTGNEQHDKEQIITYYKEHQPKKVLIGGGDGTVKFIIETLFDKDIIFGILPLGSANGLAKDLDLPSDLESCLEIALQDNFKKVDSILINGMKSFHLSDLGLNAELIKNYHQSKIHGKLGYFLQMFPTLLENTEPFRATISTPDTQIITQARVILVANSSKYGTGIIVNPEGKVDDDIFEIVIFRNLDVLLILKILFGNLPFEDKTIEIIQTKKATIHTDIPISFQIDGEFCGEVRQLDIEIENRKVKIATPK